MNAEDPVEEDSSLIDQVIGIPESASEYLAEHDQDEKSKASSEILLEFLEVAVHQILYVRRVYPEGAFVLRKKYNIPVQLSIHPGLNEYICSSLSSLSGLLKQDKISHLCVLLKDDLTPIENFFFEIKIIKDKNIEVQDYVELEQSLRSFLLKILSSSSMLTSSAVQRNTFEILVGCAADCEIDLNITDDPKAMKWVTIDTNHVYSCQEPGVLLPVKALASSQLFDLQLIVEKMTSP